MLRSLRFVVMLLLAGSVVMIPLSRLLAEDDLFQEDEEQIRAILSVAPAVTKSFTVVPNYTDYDQMLRNLAVKPARARIAFKLNSFELTARSKEILQAYANVLRQVAEAKFVIGGHCDTSGAADLNQRLSDQRAKSVLRYLTHDQQLDDSRFVVVGYGEGYPIQGLKGTDPKNRRVEFIRTE